MRTIIISSLIAATMLSPMAAAAPIGNAQVEANDDNAEFRRGGRHQGGEERGERRERGEWGRGQAERGDRSARPQNDNRGGQWNRGEERRTDQGEQDWRGRRDASQSGRHYDRNRDGNIDRRWDGNRDGELDRRWDRNNDDRLDRRWDRNDDERLDRRYDRNRDGDLDRRHDRNNNNRYDRDERYRHSNHGNWDRGWRNDRRYNWRGHRDRYSNYYRPGRYYAPHRRDYYRRFSVGIYIGAPYYGDRYWISDPWHYRLPAANGPYRWVRYYDDVLLIDLRSGYVVDVIHDFFW
jgi:hypothetical protein